MATSSESKKKVLQITHPKPLVRGIVEKGFSSSSSSSSSSPTNPPKPTVVPFPVARHRSYGPQWAPMNAANEDEMAEEDNDMDYAPISSFANPIQRRKKKGLDFSRWKEIVKGGDKKPQSKKYETKATTKNVVALLEVNEIEHDIANGMKSGSDTRSLVASSSPNTNGIVHSEREPPTLMDEIEAENLARLSQMSTSEIVEAQEVIMEKMDPYLLEILKKRGRDKLGKKGGVEGKVEDNKRSKMGAFGGDLTPQGEIHNESWKIWSERVEKVRELRFTLDGSVVEAGSTQLELNGTWTAGSCLAASCFCLYKGFTQHARRG